MPTRVTNIPFPNSLDTDKYKADGKIWLSPPDIGEEEYELVHEALRSNWVAPEGPLIKRFERELAHYLGVNHVVALNSGTSAIHLGLKLMGVQQGDNVIVPTFSFCAAVNPVLYLNAVPVFIDCDSESWGMDPDLLEKAILDLNARNERPKAIVMVHSYGMPANIDEIVELSRKYEIPLLEDAAESLGSTYHNKMTGNFGDVAILSFNGNKVLTTGGGGALIVPDEESYQKVLKWSTQSKEAKLYYQHNQLGYNYRLSNVLAAVGLGQLKQLDRRIEKKRGINQYYKNRLSQLPLSFFSDRTGCTSNHWLNAALLTSEQSSVSTLELCNLLQGDGIESRAVWHPLHQQPLYEKYHAFINGTAEFLFSRGVCLPSGSSLSREELHRICGKLIEVLS